MIDTKTLETAIKQKGLKKRYIASKLGLSPFGFSKKLTGVNEFKVSEMIKLSNLLDLSDNMRNEIFFTYNGD